MSIYLLNCPLSWGLSPYGTSIALPNGLFRKGS